MLNLALSYYYHGVGAPIKNSLNKTDPVIFHAWMFNGTIPGPTMRMTQGDHVQLNVYYSRDSSFIHSFHMHSIHTGMIFPGQSFTYNFIANPAGVYPYHKQTY